MKFALITGPSGFDLVREMNLGYHLVLAQYCIQNKAYLEFYAELHKLGHFIILDNGAAEMSRSIDFSQVLDVAEDLDPDEIIMPDVLGDCEETIRLFAEYRSSVPVRYRMGVPQGATWDQWTIALEIMLGDGVRSIGVAKRYEAFDGGRCAALQIFSNHNSPKIDTHLLGCYRDPFTEVYQIGQKYHWVRGVDSAAPLAHAQAGFSMHDIPGHLSYEWDVPFPHKPAFDNVMQMIHACTSF